MDNVDQRLMELCRRDEIIAVRDKARRAVEQGDEQAGYVLAWMEQVLSRKSVREGGRRSEQDNISTVPEKHASLGNLSRSRYASI